MATANDPLLRALQTGDERCPDGHALAVLGRLAREAAPPRRRDLRQAVLAAVRGEDADDSEARLIDAIYDQGSLAAAAAAPDLAQLGSSVRAAARPPREVDLLPRLEGRLNDRSSRRAAVPAVDAQTSWRIWTAVVFGHVAALVALAIFNVRFDELRRRERIEPIYPPDPMVTTLDPQRLLERLRAADPAAALPIQGPLPEAWSQAEDLDRLLQLRGGSELRASARRHYRMDACSGAVRGGLEWLVARQHAERGSIAALTLRADVDLTVQGLAALALLGEGVDDPRRAAAARRLLAWIAAHPELAKVEAHAGGIAALALIEGAVQFDDDALRGSATRLLAGLAEREPGLGHRGPSAGFLVLAQRGATLAGIEAPARLQELVDDFAASERSEDEHGLVAVQALARMSAAGIHAAEAQRLRLAMAMPSAVGEGRFAPFADCFVTLALREFGGLSWWRWSEDLQRSLLPAFRFGADGQAWVPGAQVLHAEAFGEAADCFATSMAVITLQAPYRYLPLAP